MSLATSVLHLDDTRPVDEQILNTRREHQEAHFGPPQYLFVGHRAHARLREVFSHQVLTSFAGMRVVVSPHVPDQVALLTDGPRDLALAPQRSNSSMEELRSQAWDAWTLANPEPRPSGSGIAAMIRHQEEMQRRSLEELRSQAWDAWTLANPEPRWRVELPPNVFFDEAVDPEPRRVLPERGLPGVTFRAGMYSPVTRQGVYVQTPSGRQKSVIDSGMAAELKRIYNLPLPPR